MVDLDVIIETRSGKMTTLRENIESQVEEIETKTRKEIVTNETEMKNMNENDADIDM